MESQVVKYDPAFSVDLFKTIYLEKSEIAFTAHFQWLNPYLLALLIKSSNRIPHRSKWP